MTILSLIPLKAIKYSHGFVPVKHTLRMRNADYHSDFKVNVIQQLLREVKCFGLFFKELLPAKSPLHISQSWIF